MPASNSVRVGVNGYGVIGKRVAAAVTRQQDMSLAGVSDVVSDWRARKFFGTGSVCGVRGCLDVGKHGDCRRQRATASARPTVVGSNGVPDFRQSCSTGCKAEFDANPARFAK